MNEWRYGGGAEAHGGGNGFISFFLSFYHLSFIGQRGRRVAGGSSAIYPARPEAEGISGPVIL